MGSLPTWGQGTGRAAVVAGPRGSKQSILSGAEVPWPLSDTVRGRVLGLRAGDTPVAGLLDGLVVAPG